MAYRVAERFKSVQGEGVHVGVPMAFIRFVGCSVGKKVCNACDTDFEAERWWAGGGGYSAEQLAQWAAPFEHVCLTGGEPLDQHPELLGLFTALYQRRLGNGGTVVMIHVETSGTKELPDYISAGQSQWAPLPRAWVTCSPKPGYRQDVLEQANELKVIVPGLGRGEGWPQLEDVVAWAARWPDKPIFLQPRNERHAVNVDNLALCNELVLAHPNLRLSVQLHKLLKVR